MATSYKPRQKVVNQSKARFQLNFVWSQKRGEVLPTCQTSHVQHQWASYLCAKVSDAASKAEGEERPPQPPNPLLLPLS